MPAHRVVSERQLTLLIEHLEQNRSFAVGRLSNNGPLEKRQALRHWEEVALTLNSVGVGATKTGPKWRDYWNEKKYAARKKASELQQHARGTGGGPAKKGALTPIEERILAILGKVSVQGNACVQIPVNMPSTSTAPLSLPSPGAFQETPAESTFSSRLPAPAPAPAPALAPAPAPAHASAPASSILPHSAPTPRRSYIPHVAEVPQWAMQMEQNRQATQERLATSLENIAATMAATQRSIERIEEILVAAFSNAE